MTTHQKVRFTFENADGAPEVETLWAVAEGDGLKIDNIPFYATGIACGDVVAVRRDDNGLLWFDSLIAPGGHCTVRVLLAREEDVSPLRERLREMGCASEVSDIRRLISVDVPPTVRYADVRQFLDDGEHEGRFEYEEGCLAQPHDPNTPLS
jgi:hypothetical protein